MPAYRVQDKHGTSSVYQARTAREAIRQARKNIFANRPVSQLSAHRVKRYLVMWTEKYETEVWATSADEAVENRDEDNAFQGCEYLDAVEVCE